VKCQCELTVLVSYSYDCCLIIVLAHYLLSLDSYLVIKYY